MSGFDNKFLINPSNINDVIRQYISQKKENISKFICDNTLPTLETYTIDEDLKSYIDLERCKFIFFEKDDDNFWSVCDSVIKNGNLEWFKWVYLEYGQDDTACTNNSKLVNGKFITWPDNNWDRWCLLFSVTNGNFINSEFKEYILKNLNNNLIKLKKEEFEGKDTFIAADEEPDNYDEDLLNEKFLTKYFDEKIFFDKLNKFDINNCSDFNSDLLLELIRNFRIDLIKFMLEGGYYNYDNQKYDLVYDDKGIIDNFIKYFGKKIDEDKYYIFYYTNIEKTKSRSMMLFNKGEDLWEVATNVNDKTYECTYNKISNNLRINFGSLIPHTLFNTVRYLGDYLCLEEFYVSDEEFKSYEYLLKLSKEEKKKKYDNIIDTICYFLENYPYCQLLRCWASPSSVFISGSKKLLKTFNEKCKHFRYLVNEFRGENFCCPFILQAPHFVSSYENVEVLEYMHKEMKLDIKDHYQSFIWLCISFERFEYLEYAIKLDYPIKKSFMENLYDDEELNKKKFYNRKSMSKIDKITKFINICNKYKKVFL